MIVGKDTLMMVPSITISDSARDRKTSAIQGCASVDDRDGAVDALFREVGVMPRL